MSSDKWYRFSNDKVMEKMKTTERGLDKIEVDKRLNKYGLNQLEEQKKKSAIQMFLAQFKDFMVGVLIAATLISGLLGEYADAVTIMAIIFINAILGFIQERRAEKSMEALKQLTAPEALVIRDGEEVYIPAKEIVPGDIVILEAGTRVPADLRILEANNMEIDEALLTGESMPVKKINKELDKGTTELGLGDRVNMAFSGTVVTRGRGRGVVVATGMKSEMGQIAGLMQGVVEEDTPLQKRLEQLGKVLVAVCLLISATVVGLGIYQGKPAFQMFLAGVSLAVAAIPEGLPAVVTIALAIGVQKMIKRNAIIRKLPAVETLGCATVICSDKTGTLTQNQMTVRQVVTGKMQLDVTGQGYDPRGDFIQTDSGELIRGDGDLEELLKIFSLCNNAVLKKGNMAVGGMFRGEKDNKGWEISGDPTEGALSVLAAKGGFWKEQIERKAKRIQEFPFDSERKMMSVVYQESGEKHAYVKGAADVIIKQCKYILMDGKTTVLTEAIKDDLIKQTDQMAKNALRVLAGAIKPINSQGELSQEDAESDMVFVGLAGMIDPPRPDAKTAVTNCSKAGIRTVMITGDHQVTAAAVAKELGIISGNERVLTGVQLDELDDKKLENSIDDVAVFARVSPKHKLRIVKALKNKGHVVGMTGDGVNDAPAVKEADIGIAMGITGTDVTKEASAMVLSDDNFSTIVAAIEEGRGIYDNIRKFIRYLLSCNVGEVLTMFLAALAGLPLPLLPIQILWVNLVTDGLPAMALGVDNKDPDVMSRKPRNPRESVFSRGLSRKIIVRGLQIGIGTLIVFVLGMMISDGNLDYARTMAFTTLVFSQLFHVFECKSERYSVFQVGVFSNPYLIVAVAISTLMQLTVIYTPFFQNVFSTVALDAIDWGIILIVAGWKTMIAAVVHFLIKPIWKRITFRNA
ncbi:Ca2+-transporting ATPase [Desulfitispora alkaliphila]|uniref:calcium-transporting P-type ATPase, PMR1-type n=1 Tax=Desulfitispora alkaliphila TaxID=622674 RepID=UPI003D25F140